MTNIVQRRPPPTEFLVFEEGIVPTEYGPLPVTKLGLQSAFDNWQKRGHKLGSDIEHLSDESRRNPKSKTLLDEFSPVWMNLSLRTSDTGKTQLWATDCEWDKDTAEIVARGGLRFFSPDLRPNTDFSTNIDIKKIALTNDPAIHARDGQGPTIFPSQFSIEHAPNVRVWKEIPMAARKKKAQAIDDSADALLKLSQSDLTDDAKAQVTEVAENLLLLSQDGPPPPPADTPSDGASKQPPTAPPTGATGTDNVAPQTTPPAPAKQMSEGDIKNALQGPDPESLENENLKALMDVMKNISNAVVLQDAVNAAQAGNAIVATMIAAQLKEQNSMTAQVSAAGANPLTTKTDGALSAPPPDATKTQPTNADGKPVTDTQKPAAPAATTPAAAPAAPPADESAKKLSILESEFPGKTAAQIAGILLSLKQTVLDAQTAVKIATESAEETESKRKLSIVKAGIAAGKLAASDSVTQEKLLSLPCESIEAFFESRPSLFTASKPADLETDEPVLLSVHPSQRKIVEKNTAPILAGGANHRNRGRI
jgi:hypothetical protein